MDWLRRLFTRSGSPAVAPRQTRGPDPDVLAQHRLGHQMWSARALALAHPPVLHHASKVALAQLVPLESEPDRAVSVSRFSAIPLPGTVPLFAPPLTVTAQPGFSPYPPVEPGLTRWHLNFAHHELFCAYGDAMFAQDEIQVAEHPILASVREALLGRDDGLVPKTVVHGAPTPVLITGASRRLAVGLSDADGGSLYGHRLAAADPAQVQAAATVLDAPATSNILAIEAPVPTGSGGRYTSMEIEHALLTAYSGLRAAVCTSWESGPSRVVVHTGMWGCGAYGGDPTLMTAVQLIAASMAGVDELVISTGSTPTALVTGLHSRLADDFALRAGQPLGAVRSALRRLEARWGASDGN